MRILVVGAGATGGYFGGRLAAAGRDVTFLVRPARAVQLRSDGLAICSPHGDLKLTPRLVTTAEPAGIHDLVLLAVKAYALAQAIDDLAGFVGPESMILPLLNGMRHVDLLAGRFGERVALGGVCQVTTTLEPDGTVRQLNDRHEIVYGVLDGAAPSDRLPDIATALQNCGFTTRLSDRIGPEMWEKWVYVATVGAITCLMRGTIGEVVAAPDGAGLGGRLLAECAGVAAAAGAPIRDDVLAQIRATVSEPGSATASSLYRDLLRGAAVEADHVIGDLVDRAALAGVDVPVLRLAYTNLRVYQNARTSAVDGVTTGPTPGAAGR